MARLSVSKRSVRIGLLTVAIGAGAGYALSSQLASKEAAASPSYSQSPPATLRNAGLQPCGTAGGADIAYVVTFAPGHTLAEFSVPGFTAVPLFQPTAINYSPSTTQLYVVVANAPATLRPAALTSSSSFTYSGWLSQSTDASLLSCNYRLADKPDALALAQKGFGALVSSNLATQSSIDDPSTIYIVADDPADANLALVIAAFNSGSVTATATTPKLDRTSAAALINKTTGQIVELGPTNLYATP